MQIKMKTYIETHTGQRINPFDAFPHEIHIADIAHALSNICRFTGHCREFYSVAQHSVLVSELLNETDALAGLLHDATEAYICDIARPLKKLPEMKWYREREKQLHSVIMEKYNLSSTISDTIKEADHIMLITEARDLGFNYTVWPETAKPLAQKITPWEPITAKRLFIKRFHDLRRN